MNDTNKIESESDVKITSQNINIAEQADTLKAEQLKSPKVSKEDFIQKQEVKTQQNDEIIQKEREARAESIADSVYNRFVEVDDNWSLDFSKVPKDMQWAVWRIQKKFQNPLAEEPHYQTPVDVNSIVEQKFKEKEFESEVSNIISDDSLSDEQKEEIKQEYLTLSKWTHNADALRKAKELVQLRHWSKKIIWNMPNLWKPSVDWSKKSVITNEQLSWMSQKDYERYTDLAKDGKITIV